MIQLAAFLGNPGSEYARNRHNAGRMLAEALPFYASIGWQKKYKGLYAPVDSARLCSAAVRDAPPPGNIHFLMPETYMNLSGESVFAAASFFKIKPESILLIHDELELPLGTLSLKFSGGLGGHNGLRSMKACFGSADFWRLRIGIGRPSDRGRPDDRSRPDDSGRGIAGWVLSDFTGMEREALAPVLEAGAALLLEALILGPENLLPEWAKKKITPPQNAPSNMTG